ncbi:aldehyde dehydrogenase [Pseudomonas cichorii]|uniref:coniferyl aldehyde dehydrogenase n=1 Tax=Pseudomonas cichorii TaxID=36746 RepID=UPI001910749D|nr:coniferyl aldehyde dehydrogenase [Pseudomonas cichorii]GFM79283.1 aldehyde dehydrogenase [Pseudomonas cichorii]
MPFQPDTKELKALLLNMKRAHTAAGPADAKLRQDRLIRGAKLLSDNHEAIGKAINADFGNRSLYQSLMADTVMTVKMLQHSAEHVAEWMKPEQVAAPGPGMQAWIQQQPLGVVGVISPWNFPINLSFGPLAGVFAAGNTAMLKPSELTPRTSELLAELIAGYFDPLELAVVLGDADLGASFSGLPFDHLVFTGSTTVGRHVMRAAAENLVPVTLELGGKSPVVVDEDFDIRTAIERTLTIKTFNAGQICLSPDYMMIPKSQVEALTAAGKSFVTNSLPSIQSNQEYTSIISQRHYERLVGLIDDARSKGATIVNLAPEGEPGFDAKTRKIAPHLLLDVNDDMQVMQEEIFGPLLPVKTYTDRAEPVAYINANPRPLAAYYFGNDSERQHAFALQTTSGALVVNDVMSHVSIDTLPFGGVGASGIGAYHGVHGFRRFTHAKPVVIQSEDGAANLRMRAPYGDKSAPLEAFLKG